MSEANERPQPGPLDEAIRALAQAPVPPGPTDDLIAATAAAIDNQLAGAALCEQQRRLRRRRWIMATVKYGSLTTATAATVAVALMFWPAGGSAADDLKTAVRKAEAAKTSRMRTEIDGAGVKMTFRLYRDQSKVRSEVEPGGLVVVVNAKAKNKGLMLMKATKSYRVLDADKDEMVREVTKSVKSALTQFKLPGDDQVRGLAAEYLDGRKTKVYEAKGVKVGETKADLKIWIDPRTNLPVQSRLVTHAAGGKSVTAVTTYLGFDEELDEKLFDTAVPAGFKELEAAKKKE